MVGLFSFPKRQLKKLIKNGDYDEAIKLGNSLEKNHSKDPDFLFIMGSLYYLLEDAKKSISYYDRVLEINEFDTEALLLKARIHVFLKEKRKAQECCNKILDVDSEHKEAKDILLELDSN